MQFVFQFFLLIFAVSCIFFRPNYVRKGEKQIDSLMVLLNAIEKQIQLIDTVQLRRVYTQYQQSISLIKKVNVDTIDNSYWYAMSLYGQIRKPLRNYLYNLPKFHKETEYSKNQLLTLSYDLKKKLISKSQFENYIQAEKESILKLYESFFLHTNDIEMKLRIFDSLYPIIQSFINKSVEQTNQ